MKTYYLHIKDQGRDHWFTVEAYSVHDACRLLDAFEAGIRTMRGIVLELESISVRKARGVEYQPLIKE